MGVITTDVLQQGKLFGPVPKHVTLTDPAVLIGRMTCDNRPDIHTVKLDLNEYADQNRIGEWVPYIQPARDEREQNVEAFLKDGQLHYRTLHTIHPNEELLVWYHKDLAHMLGIPHIQALHIKDDGSYTCPYCMDTFRYPNSIRAHMRFKCEQRKPVDLSGSLRPPLKPQEQRPHAAYPFGSSGTVPEHAMHIPFFALDPLARFMHPTSVHENTIQQNRTTQSSPTSSPRSNTSQSTENHSPRQELVAEQSARSPGKRAALNDPLHEELSPASKRILKERFRAAVSSSPDWSTMNNKADQNQNYPEQEEETVSAFRKVEKQHSPPRTTPPPNNNSPKTSNPIESIQDNHEFLSKPDIEMLNKRIRPGFPHPSFVPPFPFLPGTLPTPIIPTANINENLPLRIAEIYRNTLKMNEFGHRTGGDKLTDIRNIENNNFAPKLPFFSEPKLPFPLQYYKSNNPMVDKLLHAPTQPVTQNWCAKCNATFRMTSDLVYHMRSHHKQPGDPGKKKREDKLKCNVCGETFRERHHLTRHMSSHNC